MNIICNYYYFTGIELALATVELLGSVCSANSAIIVTLWFPVSARPCNIAIMHNDYSSNTSAVSYILTIILVKCLALWGECERNDRHYSDQQTVQNSVQQPRCSLLLSRATQTGGGWIGSAAIAIS